MFLSLHAICRRAFLDYHINNKRGLFAPRQRMINMTDSRTGETRLMAQTPPMGWNSWNMFGNDISDSLIRETADTLVDSGLAAAGYNYVVIDDCWSLRDRDADGRLVADPEKFPSGMKSLSDYIHSKGLKFGMYSCSGTRTCANFPGSYEHEFTDAASFAAWGADLLKYDYCFKPMHIDGHLLYKRIAMALRNSGRDILLSACSWGRDSAESFMRSAGAGMWRSTGDIFDNWQSIKGIILKQKELMPYGGQGCIVDMDMLVVGMHGRGNVGLGGCTDMEYRSHFSAWCLFASPLMIGCDIRSADPATMEILSNKELIAVDQDPEVRQPWLVRMDDERLVCVRPLAGGDYAIGLFNLSDTQKRVDLEFWDMGLDASSGCALALRDLWAHEDIGVVSEHIDSKLEPHDCLVYRAHLVKKGR
jgi:alpha-galactosidase